MVREEMEDQLQLIEKVQSRLEESSSSCMSCSERFLRRETQEQNQLNLFYTMYNDSYKFQYEMKKARLRTPKKAKQASKKAWRPTSSAWRPRRATTEAAGGEITQTAKPIVSRR